MGPEEEAAYQETPEEQGQQAVGQAVEQQILAEAIVLRLHFPQYILAGVEVEEVEEPAVMEQAEAEAEAAMAMVEPQDHQEQAAGQGQQAEREEPAEKEAELS